MGVYILNNGNILISNFEKGEIEGLTIIITTDGNTQLFFMKKSKPKISISDDNEKKNIKLSSEYKNLMSFYEKHIEVVESFLKEKCNY